MNALADFLDALRAAGPEHLTMDRWAKVRRPWGEWEPLEYLYGALRLTEAERAATDTVLHPFVTAARVLGITVEEAHECYDTTPNREWADSIAARIGIDSNAYDPHVWDLVTVGEWNMAAAFSGYWDDPDGKRSDRYHATRQRWWWATFVDYLERRLAEVQ